MAALTGEKKRRLDMHNGWPQPVAFRAEGEFRKLIQKSSSPAPFVAARLGESTSNEFHIYLGNLVDGLDALPYRPDYMSDHCFRIIDGGGKQATNEKGTGGAVKNLAHELFKQDQKHWTEIVDVLSHGMPTYTGQYIAKNVILSAAQKIDHHDEIYRRVKYSLGSRLADFIAKYPNGVSGSAYRGGNYIRKLLATSSPTSTPSTGYVNLDLNSSSNLLPADEKLRLIISLLLYMLRNERQHGATVSPFRSSTANLKRYAHFYYAAMCAYSVALGVISLRFPTVVTSTDILSVTTANIAELKLFFGANAT